MFKIPWTKVKSKRAASDSEYALAVGLIAVVALVALIAIGGRVDGVLTRVGNSLSNAASQSGATGPIIEPPPPLPNLLSITTTLPLNFTWTTGTAGSPNGAKSLTVKNNGAVTVTGLSV